jgi:prepilin-type N-terminal cleavage/methylation domain-containing protein
MNPRGFTLLETLFVLLLITLGLGLSLPAARRQADRMAVIAARESVVGLIALARREARASGGASLQLRRDGGRMWVESSHPPGDTLSVESSYGVRVELASASVAMPFDALGIGRLANRTLTFTRGAARTVLTISAYGRVRRQ